MEKLPKMKADHRFLLTELENAIVDVVESAPPKAPVQIGAETLYIVLAGIVRLRRENAELRFALAHAANTPIDESAARIPAQVAFAGRSHLNARIRTKCATKGIATLGELASLTPMEILHWHSISTRSLAKIEEVLAGHGLELKGR